RGAIEPLWRRYDRQAKNSFELKLRQDILDPAELWTLFAPDQAKARPIPMDRVLNFGPMSGLAYQGSNPHKFTIDELNRDEPGIIKEIIVRAHNLGAVH